MEIKNEVRKYIAENFLPNAPLESIDDNLPLISGGIIDSIGMIGLVAFLESRFDVEFMPREIDVQSLDSLLMIEEMMRKKLANRDAGVAADEKQPIR